LKKSAAFATLSGNQDARTGANCSEGDAATRSAAIVWFRR